MKDQRQMIAGPQIDALIAKKFLGGEVKAYSTNSEYAGLVLHELGRRGLEVEYDTADGVTCTLLQDSRPVVSMWGITFEEAICRSALKLMGSDPA